MKRDLTPAQLAQEITVTLPFGVVLQLAEQQPAPPGFAQALAQAVSLPAIGAAYEGGIFAGPTLHEGQLHALVLLPGEAERMNWADAQAFARNQDGRLPSRIDQIVLFKNLKSEFKDAYYWSGEQFAGNDAYAWGQCFSGGNQCNGLKGSGYRCRAVRSLPIR